MRIIRRSFKLAQRRQVTIPWDNEAQIVSANLSGDGVIDFYILASDDLDLVSYPYPHSLQIKTIFFFLTDEPLYPGLNYLTTVFDSSGVAIHLFCD